ncbi:hypothetical protein DS62_10400 [Smithella sp. SC_K08D17]|nr:hypothetical protein KD27_02110 [Smithella sp. D17]KIE18477.1 hypothetical protein DS62_10400 [Smithella sp. SC_K08D17]
MKKLFANIVKVDSNGIPYNIPNTQYKKMENQFTRIQRKRKSKSGLCVSDHQKPLGCTKLRERSGLPN